MDQGFLTKLVTQGYSQYAIGKMTGKAPTTIRYWLCKYGLGTRRVRCCRRCGQTDPERFTPGRYSRCRSCRGRGQTRQHRRHKALAVAYKGGRCQVCGYNRCMAALDFHHLDPNAKDPNWRLMRNWSFERIRSELDKCMLVCRNCHAEIHFGA